MSSDRPWRVRVSGLIGLFLKQLLRAKRAGDRGQETGDGAVLRRQSLVVSHRKESQLSGIGRRFDCAGPGRSRRLSIAIRRKPGGASERAADSPKGAMKTFTGELPIANPPGIPLRASRPTAAKWVAFRRRDSHESSSPACGRGKRRAPAGRAGSRESLRRHCEERSGVAIHAAVRFPRTPRPAARPTGLSRTQRPLR